MPRFWYVSAEMHKEITTWEELRVCFAHTFSFVDTNIEVKNALQIIRDVFLKFVTVAYPMDRHAHYHMQTMMECSNVSNEPEDDDELLNINIPETAGSRDVTALDIPTDPIN